jgi:hypothetical protein
MNGLNSTKLIVTQDCVPQCSMQFFISASGCKGKISSQMQSSMEHAVIIRHMTEEFDEVLYFSHLIFIH